MLSFRGQYKVKLQILQMQRVPSLIHLVNTTILLISSVVYLLSILTTRRFCLVDIILSGNVGKQTQNIIIWPLNFESVIIRKGKSSEKLIEIKIIKKYYYTCLQFHFLFNGICDTSEWISYILIRGEVLWGCVPLLWCKCNLRSFTNSYVNQTLNYLL